MVDASELTKGFFKVPENGTAGPLRMAFTNFVFRQLSDHKALRANLVPEQKKCCALCSEIARL